MKRKKEQYNAISNEYQEAVEEHTGRDHRKNAETAKNYHAATKKLSEFLTKHNLLRK